MSETGTDLLAEELVQTAKMASLGAMVGCVAHELNNPLTVISGNAQYLLMKAEKEGALEDEREPLRSLVEYATTCSAIVRGLLDFVRCPAVGRESVDPEQVIENTLVFLERELVSESIRCERRFALAGSRVEVNRGQLQQVFLNLIMNARDAMLEGGSLTVSTARVDGERVEITFTDTGLGIRDEVKEKVFEPFFTTKARGQGTGLGLSVCRQIVEDHCGSIRVESRVGRGTAVTVVLPCEHGGE